MAEEEEDKTVQRLFRIEASAVSAHNAGLYAVLTPEDVLWLLTLCNEQHSEIGELQAKIKEGVCSGCGVSTIAYCGYCQDD